MSTESRTRSRLIALVEEVRTMREGYVFLDEKCLLLATEMAAQLNRYDVLRLEFGERMREAQRSLHGALQRHGIEGLSVYPAMPAEHLQVVVSHRSLLGVPLGEVEIELGQAEPPPAVYPSPEADGARSAFVALAQTSTRLAVLEGNLSRLHHEYRRTVRRASAIHDVVLPELERELADMDAHLDEMEREEAQWVRASRDRRV